MGATPQNSELTVNSEMQMRKNLLRPTSDTSHPVIGRTIAFDTRYEVSTHVLSSLLAPRLPAMCGSATFAMLVSSTSMNAASDTTNAISQGFALGVHTDSGMATVEAAALTALPRILGSNAITKRSFSFYCT